MATLNWQTLDEAHKGGSDTLKVGLTSDQATALGLTGPTWVLFSYLDESGGSFGRERSVSVDYTEGGTRDESIDLDEAVIKGAVKQTSKRVLDLLDLMETEYVTIVRYLPLKVVGASDETHQVIASAKAKIDRENWSISTGRTDKRTRAFTLRLYKADGAAATVKPYVLEEVDASDDTGWPSTLDGFKEADFAAA